jgi:hypothetical protein
MSHRLGRGGSGPVYIHLIPLRIWTVVVGSTDAVVTANGYLSLGCRMCIYRYLVSFVSVLHQMGILPHIANLQRDVPTLLYIRLRLVDYTQELGVGSRGSTVSTLPISISMVEVLLLLFMDAKPKIWRRLPRL